MISKKRIEDDVVVRGEEDGRGFAIYYMFLIYGEENKLFLAMGTPRKWLKDGKAITVERAATYFGTLGYELHSRVSSGEIEAVLKPPKCNSLEEVVIRFRHPEKKLMREVIVNGVRWDSFKF